MGLRAPIDEDCSREEPEFRLRPLKATDRAAYGAALGEQAVAAMLSTVSHPLPPEEADMRFGKEMNAADHGVVVRAIQSRGAFAGLVGLYPHEASGGLELAYFLRPRFWGQGLAKTAARAIVDEVFPQHAAPGIWARVAEDNPASLRVVAGLGCEPVGTLERFFVSRNATVSCRLFWLDRRHFSRDWTAVETARLCLTPPCAADLDRIVDLAGDREIAVQTARIPHPYTRADADFFLNSIAAGEPTFAVRSKAGHGALIGCVGYRRRDDGRVELGYWLGRPYWGQGFATEAVQAVIDLAFAAFPVDEVNASARVTNYASRRVLEKCGFQANGTGLVRSTSLGGSVAVDYFRLDRRAWESLLAWKPAVRRSERVREGA